MLTKFSAAADPDRIFFVAKRSNTNEDTMDYDLSRPSAQIVAGAGAQREEGRFIPR